MSLFYTVSEILNIEYNGVCLKCGLGSTKVIEYGSI